MNSFIANKIRIAVIAALLLLLICCSIYGVLLYKSSLNQLRQQQFVNELTAIEKLDNQLEQSFLLVNNSGLFFSELFKTTFSAEQAASNFTDLYKMDLLTPGAVKNTSFSNQHIASMAAIAHTNLRSLSATNNIKNTFLAWQNNEQSFRYIPGNSSTGAPSDILIWLALHTHESKSNLNKAFIPPPVKVKSIGKNQSFMIYSFVNKEQQYFVIAELELQMPAISRTSQVEQLLWHSKSGFMVQSNIEEQNNRYILSSNPLLAVTALPPEVQKFVLFERGNNVQNTSQIVLSDGSEKLLTKRVIGEGNYEVLLTKPASNIQKQALIIVRESVLYVLLIALMSLLVFYFLAVKLLANPASKLIEYIERQSSVFETELPKIPMGWFQWFEKIQLSFQDNRNLLKNLTSKNKELDLKVKERTRELVQQTISKDRNLALNRAMMNTIPNNLYYKNVSGGFLGCNSAYENLVGIKEDDLVAKTAIDIFSPEQAERIESVEQKIIETNQVHIDQLWQKDSRGNDVLLRWLYSPITSSRGEVLGILGLGQDITEQENSFQELSQAMREVERANQVKGDFIANISHEIRTPMNSIIGMLQLLDDSISDPNQKNYTNVAQTSANNLLKVINSILDFSKASAEKLEVEAEVFSISEVLDSSFANSTSKAMLKGVILDAQFANGFPEFFIGDEVKLAQIFTNLIGNAVKFTDSGSVIVTGQLLETDGDKQKVQFKVTDTGIGIAEHQQQKVFEAFSQADTSVTRKYGGTGLGLTITYQLVQLLGGTIELDSKVNRGSTFTLTFELGHVDEQPEIELFDADWFYWDQEQNIETILQSKLATFGIHALPLPLSHKDLVFKKHAILFCRPEALEHLPVHILEFVKSQKIKLQPVSYTINQKPNLLAQYPHYPMLTAPFNVQTLMLNLLQKTQILPHKLVKNPASLPGLRILIVEDNKVNQQVLCLMLEKECEQVMVVNNGAEALVTMANNSFDIVITDIQMPVVDGLTLAKNIRQTVRNGNLIPIIAVSAHSSPADLNKSELAGIDVHLTKPINKNKLIQVIQNLCFNQPKIINDELHEQIDFDYLLGQFSDSMDTAKKVLQRFLDSQSLTIANCVKSFEEQDFSTVKKHIHTLKGVLGSIGAKSAYNSTVEYERQLKQTQSLSNPEFEQWQNSINKLMAVLEQFLQ